MRVSEKVSTKHRFAFSIAIVTIHYIYMLDRFAEGFTRVFRYVTLNGFLYFGGPK